MGGVPVLGGETADSTALVAETLREVKIYLGGGSKGGGGVPDDGGIHLAMTEHGCTVYRYAINARPG